jgi:hypothetical protein
MRFALTGCFRHSKLNSNILRHPPGGLLPGRWSKGGGQQKRSTGGGPPSRSGKEPLNGTNEPAISFGINKSEKLPYCRLGNQVWPLLPPPPNRTAPEK